MKTIILLDYRIIGNDSNQFNLYKLVDLPIIQKGYCIDGEEVDNSFIYTYPSEFGYEDILVNLYEPYQIIQIVEIDEYGEKEKEYIDNCIKIYEEEKYINYTNKIDIILSEDDWYED